MTYEVVRSDVFPNSCVVLRDTKTVAVFFGDDAENLAREYVAWKNAQPTPAAPCLMCGKNSMEVVKERSSSGGFYYIAQCQNCHETGGPVTDSEREAIAAWNRWAGGKSEQQTPTLPV